jgi:hypothetical protein
MTTLDSSIAFSVVDNLEHRDAAASFSILESEGALASFSVIDLTSPTPSNVLVVPVSGHTVYMKWDCSSIDGLEFEIYMAMRTVASSKVLVARTAKTSLFISGLPAGVSLYFWVSSFLGNDNQSDLIPGYKAAINSSKAVSMSVTAIAGSSIPAGTIFAFDDQYGITHAIQSVNSVTF